MVLPRLKTRSGSSPLARGTLTFNGGKPSARGLIPARAGNTHVQWRQALRAWAHPRSRGEHTAAAAPFAEAMGSSPLARGTQKVLYTPGRMAGLIPARAGNTCSRAVLLPISRAHPRSRGEHERAARYRVEHKGSSPLARGTRDVRIVSNANGGLIPARAGNTNRTVILKFLERAHPRSRGEHIIGSYLLQ